MKKRRIILVLAAMTMIFACGVVTCNAETIDNGTCGNGITWSLDDEYCLSVEGSGSMADYTFGYSNGAWVSTAPWKNHLESIKKVTVSSGVTVIGKSAFAGCSNLEEVSLSNGVKTISESAFYKCASLSTMNFPSGLETIEQDAFWDCRVLKSVSLPESMDIIGDGAFRNCYGIETLDLPEEMSAIGEWAFVSCSSITSVGKR